MRRRSRRSRRPGPLGLSLALLSLVGAVLAGCTSAGPRSGGSGGGGGGGGAALSVRDADRILASVMATNNRANAALDSKVLAGYETGSAYAIDSAQYKASRLAHASSSVPFSVAPLQTVVGSPAAPDRFLVVGRTVLSTKLPRSKLGPCPDDDTLLLFERSAPGDRWRIVLEPSTSSGSFATLATSKGGSASALPPALARVAAGLPSRVATALVRYEASGRLGSLQRSDFTGACWAVPNPRLEVQQAEQAGFDARELFSPLGPDVSFRLADGRALVLFALGDVETIVAPVNSAIAWHHDSQVITSDLLPAGRYSRVTETGEVEIAAFVEPSGAYTLVGSYSGTTSITGARVKAQTPGGPPTLVSFAG